MSHRAALIALAVLATGLCGCAPTVKYVPTSEPFCRAIETVCISKEDALTEGTAQQIEANNLGHARVCKRRVECKTPKPTS